MKKIILYILLACSSLVHAYDWENYSLSGGTEIVSNYNWRGTNVGGLSLQPWVEFSIYGLSVEAWSSLGSGTYDDFYQFVPELDLSLSYTFLDDHITIGFSHYYYFEGPFFGGNYYLDNIGSSQSEFELSVYGNDDCPLEVGFTTMFGGGDYYSANGEIILQNSIKAKKLYSTYIYVNYTFEINDIEIVPEIGFSPNPSMYTYYDYNTNKHLGFAMNNISCKVIYTFLETDLTIMYVTGDVFFNLFDVGYEKFEYGKNVGLNVGVGIEL